LNEAGRGHGQTHSQKGERDGEGMAVCVHSGLPSALDVTPPGFNGAIATVRETGTPPRLSIQIKS
jgi:hypothetical protein